MNARRTPGKVVHNPPGLSPFAIYSAEGDGKKIAVTHADKGFPVDGRNAEAVANAYFLAIAWNTHDAMVALLREVRETFSLIDSDGHADDIRARIDDVLARATDYA